MYVDLLTDGDLNKLSRLHVYNPSLFKPGNGYRMPLSQQSRNPPLAKYRTELVMYFAYEVSKQSATEFFKSFGYDSKRGMRLVRTYAVLMNQFAEAFGRILPWEEQAVMMPEQWRTLCGLDAAEERAGRPWDPATVDVTTPLPNGGTVRRPAVTDTTNLPLAGQPTCRDAQMQLYNAYYSGWVGKAAVCALPLGWVYAPRVMAGGVSDSAFFVRSGLAKMQQEQAEEDGGPPFLTIADKGNRQYAELWERGEQALVTPTVARYACPFSPLAMLQNVCVASWRIFNECVIARPKKARFGVPQALAFDFQLVELFWRNYVFRCNAVYMPYSRDILKETRRRVLVYVREAARAAKASQQRGAA